MVTRPENDPVAIPVYTNPKSPAEGSNRPSADASATLLPFSVKPVAVQL